MMLFSRRDTFGLMIGGALALPSVKSFAQTGTQVLRIGLGSDIVKLDPILTSFGEEYIYNCLVYNGLTRMTEEQTIEPDLAESWSYSDDLKTWTFKLRSGVKFHDGSVLTSADVVALIERILDPSVASPSAGDLTMIDSVEAPDDTTVVFHLKYPYGPLADQLTDRHIKVMPRNKVDQINTHPIGTGPFKFVSQTPGDKMVLTKNENYFEPGLPKLDGVELQIIPEMSTKVAAVRSGSLDMIWNLPVDQVKNLSSDSAIRPDSVPSGSWDAAVLNNLTKPFNDPRVRLAVQTALSKKDLVELVLFGQGEPTITTIPKAHPFYASNIEIAPADPAAARKLLAEAGYADGITLPIIVPVGRPSRERLGVTLQQLLKPAGFNLSVQRVPYSEYGATVSGKAPIYIDGFFGRPTIDAATEQFLHSKGKWNQRLWHYSNPVVDKAIETARLSGDTEVQKANYIKMQEAFYKDPGCLFAYTSNFACAYASNVKGVKTHPMRWVDLRFATKV